MKKTLMVIRWVVGLLFIFSGLIKANDPLGLSYKMQEFFEVWNLHSLNNYTLTLSLIMNVFEVLAGVAIIIGWRVSFFSWLLLLLILFFTFLTGYALFSGKIKTCGCFGDCLPLTPAQSFIKDLILLLLIFLLFVNRNKIYSGLLSRLALTLLLSTAVVVSILQAYVLKHLPIIDCLPYKSGNNIFEQMKTPANAVPDSIVMTFKYRKNGKIVEFTADNLPEDLDSTYEFIDRYDKIVRRGNAIAPITDFSLHAISGTDTTNAILSQPNDYVLLFAIDFSTADKWITDEFYKFAHELRKKNIPLFIVTADKAKAQTLFKNNKSITILLCDATVIKTAARVNPTYFIMHKANIKEKYSYADINDVRKNINRLY